MLSMIPKFHPDETTASFCSRIAEMNGVRDADQFGRHFKFRIQGVLDGKLHDISTLAKLTNVSSTALLDATAQRRDGRFLIGRTWYSDKFVDTKRLRICPQCVMDDLRTAYRSIWNCYGRASWTVKLLRTCPIHKAEIVCLPTNRAIWMDFSAQIKQVEPELDGLATAATQFPQSPLQTYLSNRFASVEQERCWFDNMPLQAVAHFCELLGSCIRNGTYDPPPRDTRSLLEAGDLGFETARPGQQALEACLSKLLSIKTLHNQRTDATASFGRLAVELWEHQWTPGYLSVLGLLQDVAMGHYAKNMGVI